MQPDEPANGKGVAEDRAPDCAVRHRGPVIAGTCSWCGADVAPETKQWPPRGIETK